MDRRSALKLLGATAASMSAGALGGCATTQPMHTPFDVNNPEDLHLMHRKLAYTLDDRLVYWNIDAVRMGFRDGQLTPFWNMHVGLIYKIEDISQFRYRVNYFMKIFYSDLKTGKLLETFDNPYTGETREVMQPKLVKSKSVFGLRGIERPESKDGDESKNGPSVRHDEIGPAKVIGDDVWLNSDSVFRAETPNRFGHLVQVNDWSTYHGSMRQISDPNVMSAPATHTFNDLNTFNHDWVGMKGVDAWSISRGFGRKSHNVDGMPEAWKAFMAKNHSDILSDNPDFS
ncbi:twin-arginine translocation signal domain-containing protein [Hirschia litorea]|uniref:Uncharacterized protein n=1 Tax=Hirschia litorea TaxID=1199156 RepID=A0ABW2IL79_9PROT